MSEAVAEIATLSLRTDINLDSGEDRQILKDTLATIARQHGFKRLYWGLKIEDPTILQMVINWTDISNHNAFMSSPGYPAFLENVGKLLSGAPSIFHVKLPQDEGWLEPFEAEVTECINAYFPETLDEASYLKNKWSAFVREVANIPNAGNKGMVGGFSIEPQTHQGVQGRMFAAFIGWPSVEAHLQFRNTEEFGKMIGMLKEGSTGVEVSHTAFKKYV